MLKMIYDPHPICLEGMEIGDGRIKQLLKEGFFQLPCVFQVVQRQPRPNFYVLSEKGLTIMPWITKARLKDKLHEFERGEEE